MAALLVRLLIVLKVTLCRLRGDLLAGLELGLATDNDPIAWLKPGGDLLRIRSADPQHNGPFLHSIAIIDEHH